MVDNGRFLFGKIQERNFGGGKNGQNKSKIKMCLVNSCIFWKLKNCRSKYSVQEREEFFQENISPHVYVG